MAFSTDESTWDAFLAEWPLERLRTMTLEEYTNAGDRHSFVYWMEGGLDQYGSIWGGSAFKFGIYSRNEHASKQGDASIAYDADYGWYRRFGETHEAAFEAVRNEVVAVAEAARAGQLAAIDNSELGPAYRWKIAFHYQDRSRSRLFPCVFLRKPLLHASGLPESDRTTPLSTLYARVAESRPPSESLMDFSHRVWRDWVMATPLRIRLTEGAVRNGYIPVNLVNAPFPESIRGGASEAEAGEPVQFRTDTGWEFDSDVRAPGSSESGRLRTRFGRYFQERNVEAGDIIEIKPDEDGVYVITHHPKNGGVIAEISPTLPEPGHVAEAEPEVSPMPVNRILYGPPGTGKTFRTIDEALRILDPDFLAANANDRMALKAHFDAFAREGRVRFVTCHQSFSYEDFVEGLRADSEEGRLKYRVEPGVFRSICESATGVTRVGDELGVREGARIWKISIDGTGPSSTRDYCLSHGEARIGWAEVGDLHNDKLTELPEYAALGSNDRSTLHNFSREIEPGDVLLCIGSDKEIQAVGVAAGEYSFDSKPPQSVRQDYVNVLPVRWLAQGLRLDILSLNGGRRFTLKTVYELTRFGWPALAEYLREKAVNLDGMRAAPPADEPYVLIIDEINRGNISRIFGELITLIEPSKRMGAPEALQVTLPYSKQPFGVPANVHLIGTMNTADRSLAGLDVALRRRFEFVEMLPDPAKLAGIVIGGVPVTQLLDAMNRRIEALLGRDYMLGHAYFMSLKTDASIEVLATIFRRQVLPLLQEYFFEDWQKIAWVLNDHRKAEPLRFVRQREGELAGLLGPDVELPRDTHLWTINTQAFGNPAAYLATIDAGNAG